MLRRKNEEEFKMFDQRDLIEANDWSDIIIFDACRYDYFKKYYPKHFVGKLLKVRNGKASWTFKWYNQTFRIKYDAVLFTPLAVIRAEQFSLLNSSPFFKVVSNREMGSKFSAFAPKLVNKTIKTSGWKGRKIIHYFAPHPPFPKMPHSNGKMGGTSLKRRLETGKITIQDVRRGYISNLKVAFEAAVEIMPYLGKKVIITADHGECLGDCGMLLHGKGYKHKHIVHVPWFKIKSVMNGRR